MEDPGPAKTKIFTIQPFSLQVCQPLLQEKVGGTCPFIKTPGLLKIPFFSEGSFKEMGKDYHILGCMQPQGVAKTKCEAPSERSELRGGSGTLSWPRS